MILKFVGSPSQYCLMLYCRINQTFTCQTESAPMEGTTCDSGKVTQLNFNVSNNLLHITLLTLVMYKWRLHK